jgi:hypothetical protein
MLFQQLVNRMCSHLATSLLQTCCGHILLTSCEIFKCVEAVNNLEQAWWHYLTCYKVVLTSLIQSWYNKNVTRLITQGCYNNLYHDCIGPQLITVISINCDRTCWNNLATSLIISTSLLQAVLTTCTILLYHDCIELVGTTLLQVW